MIVVVLLLMMLRGGEGIGGREARGVSTYRGLLHLSGKEIWENGSCCARRNALATPTRAEGRREREAMQQASGVWKPRTALAAYRALLRAQRDLFVNDSAALTSAHAETRAAFLAQADAQPADVPALVEDAFEASQFIRQNVAQAQMNERGNYGAHLLFSCA